MCWHSELSLLCDAVAVARARQFCAHWLRQVVGTSDEAQDYIDDTVLVTSELVSNAVNAGCTHTVVAIDVHRSHLRLSVADDGEGEPQVQHPPPSERHGRGLQIVQRLSQDWGVTPTAAGKQVWAELRLPVRLTGTLSCELV
jgi:anti-sigma regulatory factor (Ser/Thr protein kinase)